MAALIWLAQASAIPPRRPLRLRLVALRLALVGLFLRVVLVGLISGTTGIAAGEGRLGVARGGRLGRTREIMAGGGERHAVKPLPGGGGNTSCLDTAATQQFGCPSARRGVDSVSCSKTRHHDRTCTMAREGTQHRSPQHGH